MWNGEKQGDFALYVLQPGSSQTLRITTEPGSDVDPAWSPDGGWIAYVHSVPGGNQKSLNLISPLGGPNRTIFTVAGPIGTPTWTPDGRALVVSMAKSLRPVALWLVPLQGGDPRQLTSPPQGIPGDRDPVISPDGKMLAFCRATAWRTAELYVVDLDADLSPHGTPRRITDLGYVEHPSWTYDSSRILFGAARDGVGIWQIARNGGRLRPVFGAPETASMPTLGKRAGGYMSLVFTNSTTETSLWRFSSDVGPVGGPEEIAPSSRTQRYASYSSDGRRLAFSSDRTGSEEIWVANADGSDAVQLSDLRHLLTEQADWSPADNMLAFVSQDRAHRQIYVIDANGGLAHAITNEEGIRNGGGWSRDGTGYYYSSARSGRLEVWRASRDGGPPKQMTASGGQCGFETPRGVFHYWQVEGGLSAPLMRRTPAGDAVVNLTPPGVPCRTVPSPKGFFYKATGSSDIYLYDEVAGRSARVFGQLPRPFNGFTVTPDGHWLITDFHREEAADLMIMEHFR
jgi:Tol biopolymer transport system component